MATKEDIAAEQPQEPEEITAKRIKAVDLLYEGMIFWHEEGIKIISEIKRRLQDSGNGKDALALAKIWKGYEDRWYEIASRLAPYQSAKLSSIEVKGGTVTKYIVEVPRRAKDAKEWLEQVEVDRKALPAPITIKSAIQTDDTIDDIEYEDINGYEAHQ